MLEYHLLVTLDPIVQINRSLYYWRTCLRARVCVGVRSY